MAAPVISSSSKQSTLKKLIAKENTKKPILKHVLCLRSQEWPRPSEAIQEDIISKLSEQLSKLPNLFKKINNSSDSQIKAQVRSQLFIGVNEVLRGLEKGALECVLISGQATPAISVNHIITLCQLKSCPILCLDKLAGCIAGCTNSKCLPLALGFKKSSESYFSEVIAVCKINTNRTCSEVKSQTENSPLLPVLQVTSLKPIKLSSKEDEERILEELKKAFTAITTIASLTDEKQKKKGKKKKSRHSGCLKKSFDKAYHPQFEFGKRTVKTLVEESKSQLVIVSEEMTPTLTSEPSFTSLLDSASEHNCPVLALPGLTATLRPLCQGNVSFLGLRKFLTSSDSQENHFQLVVDLCQKAISQQSSVMATNHPSVDQKLKKMINCKQLPPLPPLPTEEEISHLYILKKDSVELAEAKLRFKAEVLGQNQPFGQDFISLSGKNTSLDTVTNSTIIKQKSNEIKSNTSNQGSRPTDIQTQSSVEVKSKVQSKTEENVTNFQPGKTTTDSPNLVLSSTDLPNFALSRSGDTGLLKINKEDRQKCDTDETEVKELGHVSNTSTPTGIDYLALSQSTRTSKKALKRKAENEEGFLSFSYKPADIKTMTSNPNRKKK